MNKIFKMSRKCSSDKKKVRICSLGMQQLADKGFQCLHQHFVLRINTSSTDNSPQNMFSLTTEDAHGLFNV